jgi:hypothetical protein
MPLVPVMVGIPLGKVPGKDTWEAQASRPQGAVIAGWDRFVVIKPSDRTRGTPNKNGHPPVLSPKQYLKANPAPT